jgi:hypothetical protein
LYSYTILAALLVLSFGFTSAFAENFVDPDNISFGHVSNMHLPQSGPEIIDVSTGEQVAYDKSKHYILYGKQFESVLGTQEKQIVNFQGDEYFLVLDPLDRTANMLAVLLLAVPFGLLVYRMSDNDPIPIKYAKLSGIVVAFSMFSMLTLPVTTGNSYWGYAQSSSDFETNSSIPSPVDSFYFDNPDNFSSNGATITLDNNNSAVLFDGSNDSLVLDSNLSEKLNDFSVSVWVKPDYKKGSPSTLSIISESDAFALAINNDKVDENFAFFSVYDGIKWHIVESKTAISEEWTHITATYSNEQIKIFVNGAQEGSINIDGDYSLTHQYGESSQNSYDYLSLQFDLVVGAFNPNSRDQGSLKNHFSGLIDDITLYDKSLSSSHIFTLEENHRIPDTIPEPDVQSAETQPEQTGVENEYGFVTDDDNPNDQKIEEVAAEGYKVKKPEENKNKNKKNQASEKAKEALEENKSTTDQSTEEAIDESTEETINESDIPEFDESAQISTSSNSTTAEALPTAPQKTAPLSEEFVADSDSLIRKLVRVSSDTDATFSDLPPINSKTQYKWKLYGDLNGTLVDLTNDPNVNLQLLDLNSDNSLDRAEWSTTDGITEYYLVAKIILATAGLHLDSDREFVDDVFYEIRDKDGIWTYDIPVDDYVRVTFERPLDDSLHIAIFAKSSGFASIEVYEKDGTEIIATFADVSEEGLSKIQLTNLVGYQDTFDFKIKGAPIAFDQIIDPATIDIQQCHNAKPTINNCEHISANQKYWATGQAGSSNSIIGFGHSQNYRIVFEDISTIVCGTPDAIQGNKELQPPDCRPPEGWTLVIEQDLTQSGEIAQDFWTGPGNIITLDQPSGTGIHPCSLNNVTNHYCEPSEYQRFLIPQLAGNTTNGTNTSGLPVYSNAADRLGFENVTAAQEKHVSLLAQPFNQDSGAVQYMHIWGVDSENVTFAGLDDPFDDVYPYSLQNGDNFETGNSQMRGTIMFNNTDSTIILAYGGHIADALDYPFEQITPSGSPYHNRIISFDGVRGDTGNQDVQMDLVPALPSLIIINKTTNDPQSDQLFNFTASFKFNNTNDFKESITQFESAGSTILTPANYTISEDLITAEGWTFASVDCSLINVDLDFNEDPSGSKDSFWNIDGTEVEIMLAEGEVVTCTYHNVIEQDSYIKINKTAINPPNEDTVFTFNVTMSNGTTLQPELTIESGNTSNMTDLIVVSSGTTSIEEILLPAGWKNNMTGTCFTQNYTNTMPPTPVPDSITPIIGLEATLEPNQALECEFINDNTAFIQVIKNTTMAVDEDTTFTFNATLQNGTRIQPSHLMPHYKTAPASNQP